MRVGLDELRAAGRPSPPRPAQVTVHVSASAGGVSDLNVVGCTVADAIERTDKFLDRAIMAELRLVRVIHGHGTGQLRRALGEFLSSHPLVARSSLASPGEGGGGVTVVELKE
jgi:DNA mismatch repair protein MutS2